MDVGAGYGRLADCYIGKYDLVTMLEPASNLRRQAKEKYGAAADYFDGDVYQLPFADGTFDAVLMVRVMHHLTDPRSALMEIVRVMKPSCKLVFNYSNKRNLFRIARWIRRDPEVKPFSEEAEIYAPELYGHHPRVMRRLVQQVGLDLSHVYGVAIGEKLISIVPVLKDFLPISLLLGRFLGSAALSPMQFCVCQKR